MAPGSNRALTRWVSRILPVIITGCVGFATYAITEPICLKYMIHDRSERGPAIAILVLLYFFLLLMAITYARLVFVVNTNPGVTPLGPGVAERRRDENKKKGDTNDIEAQQFSGTSADGVPQSVGLERFYSKDAFVCANDGRPIWCSSCGNWKEDRVHHSSEMNRCVRKMDHYCPWVGGIVSETSFKFFVQFTFYAAVYCIFALVVSAYTLSQQITNGLGADGFVIAVVALSAFFGLFTFTMTGTSMRFILVNLTNVDVIRHQSKVYQLAVRVPRGTPASSQYGVIHFPVLEARQQPSKLQTPLAGDANGNIHQGAATETSTARDQLATRTFAIVKTEMGENPWDLGYYDNWVSVMGDTIWQWLLPIKESPCCRAENNISFYELGPNYHAVRSRYGLPDLPANEASLEMQEVRRGGR